MGIRGTSQSRAALRRLAIAAAAGTLACTPAFAANLLLITNATGHPTLCQPTTIDKGAPHGFTLIGRLFDEGTICRLGRVIEEKSKVVRRHPEL